jgi:hypothetical protein
MLDHGSRIFCHVSRSCLLYTVCRGIYCKKLILSSEKFSRAAKVWGRKIAVVMLLYLCYYQWGKGDDDMLNTLLDYKLLIPLALILGFAPFLPQPHIVEKLRMLFNGALKRPVDIFDLCWHAWPFVLLAYKVIRDLAGRAGNP